VLTLALFKGDDVYSHGESSCPCLCVEIAPLIT